MILNFARDHKQCRKSTVVPDWSCHACYVPDKETTPTPLLCVCFGVVFNDKPLERGAGRESIRVPEGVGGGGSVTPTQTLAGEPSRTHNRRRPTTHTRRDITPIHTCSRGREHVNFITVRLWWWWSSPLCGPKEGFNALSARVPVVSLGYSMRGRKMWKVRDRNAR